MINIILFLFPAGLSLKIKDDLFREKMDIKDYLLLYMKYNVIINFVLFAMLFVYSYGKEISIGILLDRINFVFVYLLVSILAALILPIADEYIKKNITLKIRFKRKRVSNEKKNK